MLTTIAAAILFTAYGAAAQVCQGYGPQTPRDISSLAGANERLFALAPSSAKMNLCNIHTHTNAEHKGPGFSIFAGAGANGGYQCGGADGLTEAELTDPAGDDGAFKGAKPGETIEVHWVFSSCDVAPGEGLGACLSDQCANPQLRVEAQVFLVVNDPDAADFSDYAYRGEAVGGLHQPKALPFGGEPVVFAGSTTGPSYTEAKCSPLQVTWSVRPNCARVDISSLHEWAKANPFNEKKSHGVRQLVTSPELLAPID
ncbi:MAG: delta-class carbonic anhydrase [Pseudomonadota bacterium]